MDQTSWIAGSLFVGFLVFVTTKGQLPAYKQAIFGGQNQATSAAPAVQSSSGSQPVAQPASQNQSAASSAGQEAGMELLTTALQAGLD